MLGDGMDLDQVTFVVDENLFRLGNGLVAVRRDTARFSRSPVRELLPSEILDPDCISFVGDRGWNIVTNDKRLRTRPAEASLAIRHRLEAVHLHNIGALTTWDQLARLTARWGAVERQIGWMDRGGSHCSETAAGAYGLSPVRPNEHDVGAVAHLGLAARGGHETARGAVVLAGRRCM